MLIDTDVFIKEVGEACKSTNQQAVADLLFKYTYDLKVPTWSLHTAWTRDFRRTFWDGRDSKEYGGKKMTDEVFIDKIKAYIQKGKPCLFIEANFWGVHRIEYYEGGTESHCNIRIRSGDQKYLKRLVELLHS